jgi:hypothetical protein
MVGSEEGADKKEVLDYALVAHSGQGYHCAVCAQRRDNWVCFEEGVKASEDGDWSSFEHKRITTCIRYWKAICPDTCASREKLEGKLAPDMCLPIEVMRRRQEQYANTKKARRMTNKAVEPAPLPPSPSAVGDVQGKSFWVASCSVSEGKSEEKRKGELVSTTPVTAQGPGGSDTKRRKISSDPQQTSTVTAQGESSSSEWSGVASRVTSQRVALVERKLDTDAHVAHVAHVAPAAALRPRTSVPGSGAGAGGARAVESHSYCGVNRLEGGEGKGFAAVVDFGDKDCLIACGPWETGVCWVCFEGVDSCECLCAC